VPKSNAVTIALLIAFFLGLSPANQLHAATFNVNSGLDLIDPSPEDGVCDADPIAAGEQCTLRAAVMSAEANDEADLIQIPPGLEINLSLSGDGGTEFGDLDVGSEIEIVGFIGAPPDDPLFLPQINAFLLSDRHFNVLGGQLTLRGLRLVGGNPEFSGGALQVGGGGTAQVEHSLFLNNSANRAGAIHIVGSSQVTVEDSNFRGNSAGVAGGTAIYASSNTSLNVRRSSFVDNFPSASSTNATILASNALRVEIENSTLVGTALAPPASGFETSTGIWMGSRGELIVRNTTITNFRVNALRMSGLDGDERVIVTNSVLDSDVTACRAEGADLAAADVQIHYSLIRSNTDCDLYFGLGNILNVEAELGTLVQDAAPRLTFARPPTGPFSNVVDRGIPPNAIPDSADFRCSNEDQRSNPRPQDGNANGNARCDMGAVEEGPPEAFIVDYYEQDLLDSNPGDGQCTTIIIPGVGSACTLRAAVMEANALPGLQRILFEPSDIPVVLTQPSAPGAAGGDLNVTEAVAIEGNLVAGRPATRIENQVNNDRIFRTEVPDETVYLRNMELSGGDMSGGSGGAVVHSQGQLFLQRTVLRNNFAANGGAAAVLAGSMLIVESDIHSNDTLGSGAALLAAGGAIGLISSSVHNHLGVSGDGNPSISIVTFPGTSLSTFNSTISGNSQGIRALEPVLLFIFQNTIFDNANGALEVAVGNSSEIDINNSILAGSNAPNNDCRFFDLELAESFSFELILDSDGSCPSLAGITADPRLEPLSRPEGEISFSHRPDRNPALPSPAIDAGPEEFCLGQLDQYGRARPQDIEGVDNLLGPCDRGSIEVLADQLFQDRFEDKTP